MRGLPLVLVLILTTAAFTGPSAQAAPWNDCGGYDTTDTDRYTLIDGAWCHGVVNNCDDQTDYLSIRLQDTEQAHVQVQNAERIWYYLEGPGIAYHAFHFDEGVTAPATGAPHVYTVYVLYDHPSSYDEKPGDSWPCDDGENIASWAVKYDKIVNTPPTVTIDAPTDVVYKDTYTVDHLASDAETNGDCVWIDGRSRHEKCNFDDTWSTSRTLTALTTTSHSLTADDLFGASATTSRTVTVGQDDCGTGGDISNIISPPVTCRATLQQPVGDAIDTFGFLAPGSAGRVAFSIAPESNWGPFHDIEVWVTHWPGGERVWTGGYDGTTLEVISGDLYEIDVSSATSDGSYGIDIAFLPPPTPPALDVTWPDDLDIHQGERLTIDTTVTDPYGFDVAVRIDWGDGTSKQHPAGGGFAPSPMTASLSQYIGHSDQVQVTATNSDGRSVTETRTITMEPEHDCGLGPVGTDAPKRASTGHHTVTTPKGCLGHLGYVVEKGTFDTSDAYRIHGSPLAEPLTVHATTPDIILRTTVWLFGQIPIRGEIGASSTVFIPALPLGAHLVEVERVSGQGEYGLTMD